MKKVFLFFIFLVPFLFGLNSLKAASESAGQQLTYFAPSARDQLFGRFVTCQTELLDSLKEDIFGDREGDMEELSKVMYSRIVK